MSTTQVTLNSATSGAGGASTSATVTIPSGYTADSTLVLIFATNNQATSLGVSGGATAVSVIANAAGRLQSYIVTPNGLGQTSFTLSWTGSGSFYQWCLLRLEGYAGGSESHAANNFGTNPTAAIAVPAISPLIRTTDGNELVIWAGSVNATATFTTPSEAFYTSNTTNNAALQCLSDAPSAGLTSITFTDINRGLDDTNRNESAISMIFFSAETSDSNVFDADGNAITIHDASGNDITASFV